MKTLLVLFLIAPFCTFAQSQESGPVHVTAWGGAAIGSSSPVQGAPFSATITNKTVQTLADGNRIVQTSTGTISRDSQGRTRQELPAPPVGPVPSDAPRLVLIQDPIAYAAYTLNLADKTAQEVPLPSTAPVGELHPGADVQEFSVQVGLGDVSGGPMLSMAVADPKSANAADRKSQSSTEDLGSQTMEGLQANGRRTTRTIPAGQIGNSEPIKMVTEVWTSPELKAVVYSKRSDPMLGENTFQLSNVSRDEPDPSLFAVPSDFKIIDRPGVTVRQSNTEN